MTTQYQRSPVLILLLLSSLAACTSSNDDGELKGANDLDSGLEVTTDASLEVTFDASVNYFVAEPSEVSAGQATTLRWSVPDGAYCRISPVLVEGEGENGVTPANYEGMAVVTPNETVEYVLDCPGGPGPALLAVTVTVTPPELGCCFGDSDCPPTSVPSECYAGHCKMAPEEPNGCWNDSDCGPQERCADAFLCSVCPSACSVEDQSGFCVYKGT